MGKVERALRFATAVAAVAALNSLSPKSLFAQEGQASVELGCSTSHDGLPDGHIDMRTNLGPGEAVIIVDLEQGTQVVLEGHSTYHVSAGGLELTPGNFS